MRRNLPTLRAAALGMAAIAIAGAGPAHAQGAQPRPLPPGEGRDMLASACAQCHNLSIIVSMREGAAGWRRHVYNMVTRGAQLTPSEAEAVIGYLATNFGPGSTPVTASPVALPIGPGKELVESRCTACHDLERVAVAKRQREDWAALVANMVGRGAVASPDEAKAITSYLMAHFGAE
jgi:mono/diheme cytochrome c family protein